MANFTTLKDVAARAGTTAATVSYILNDKKGRYVSPEMRDKVLAAAKELNYIKCAGASSLKGKHTKLVAILVPQFENQFFTRIISAAESVFVSHGYDLIITNTFDNPVREKDILYRMVRQRVDGIIITPTVKGFENTENIRKAGMNLVVVDRPLCGADDYNWVTTKNYECGYKGAGYLIEKGHRNIGYIGWNSGISDLDARAMAVLDAFSDYGIDKAGCHIINGGFSSDEGRRMTKEILEMHPEITALFYGFNMQAVGGVDYLCKSGMSIPEKLSVALIGSPEWAYVGYNGFTHVDMDEYNLGIAAAQRMMDLINGKEIPSDKLHIRQDCFLVEASSVKDINKERGGIV